MQSSLAIEYLGTGGQLAHLLCVTYRQPAFVHLARVNPVTKGLVATGGWVGPPFEGESVAPYAAQAKVAELFWYGKSDGLSLTPVEGFQYGLGWMGGARYNNDIVGVSHWHQEHDRLLALLTLYSFNYEMRLHHGGFRHETEEAAREAAAKTAAARGVEVIEVPADDHLRLYVRIEDERNPKRYMYEEHQFFPNGPKTPAFHWDIATKADDLLVFVANAYGGTPVWMESGDSGPIGLFWVRAEEDGSMLGIMARERWWDIESDKVS